MSDRRLDFAALGPALFLVVCVAVGLGLDSYPQYVLAIAIISMLVGVALVVLVGLARCITLASGSIMAVGAYVSTLAVADLHVPYLATLALAILAGGAAGWVIAFPGTRFRGHNLAMVTLVFQSVCIILIRENTWLTGGAEGIHVPPPQAFGVTLVSDRAFLILIGLAGAAMMLVMTILVRGPFGKNLQAAAGNEIAAEAFGVSVRGYLTAAFVTSSLAIAFAGALLAPRVRILDPDSFGVLEFDLHAGLPDRRRHALDLGRVARRRGFANLAGAAAASGRLSRAVLRHAGDFRGHVFPRRIDRPHQPRRPFDHETRSATRFDVAAGTAGCSSCSWRNRPTQR